MAQVNKLLTISIPTYNRKSQLLRLLHSIDNQNCIELYQIQIIDNCSNYSIRDAVSSEFSYEFVDNIEFIIRPLNGGGDYNIASTFIYVNSELMWLIGDDDETLPGSIETIIEKYRSYPECSFYKYSMNDKHPQKEDITLDDVNDLLKCYKEGVFYSGDLIFMSNNVYNVARVRKYFSDCLYYSYCSACQTIPLLRALMTQGEKAMLCKDFVVKYNEPQGDHWNYVKIVASLGTFLDMNWENRHQEVKAFFNIMCSHFGIGEFLLGLLDIKDKSYRDYLYKKARNSVFSSGLGFLGHLTCFLYRIEIVLGLKVLSVGYGKLYQMQNTLKQNLKERAKNDEKMARRVQWMKKFLPKLK